MSGTAPHGWMTIPWTNKQEQLLTTMYRNGCSLEDMAEATGRTNASVRGKLRMMGLSVQRRNRLHRIFTCPA